MVTNSWQFMMIHDIAFVLWSDSGSMQLLRDCHLHTTGLST